MHGKIEEFCGVLLYDIGLDGCLNGVYTNIFSKGIICNQILVKERKDDLAKNDDKKTLDGFYACQYFNPDRSHLVGSLIITQRMGTLNIYDFKWNIDNNAIKLKGVGYQMNDRQISVIYWPEP